MQITLPAGEYYVGDPCYSVSHDAEGSEAWDAILTSSNIFEDCIKGSWNGFDGLCRIKEHTLTSMVIAM